MFSFFYYMLVVIEKIKKFAQIPLFGRKNQLTAITSHLRRTIIFIVIISIARSACIG